MSGGRVPVHSKVKCNVCGMEPIRGVRFKCSVCRRYNLCSACDAKGYHTEHAMIRITHPRQRSLSAERDRPKDHMACHTGVTCSGCNQRPIRGTRYKCTVCPSYNLCSNCFQRGYHAEHKKTRIDYPQY